MNFLSFSTKPVMEYSYPFDSRDGRTMLFPEVTKRLVTVEIRARAEIL